MMSTEHSTNHVIPRGTSSTYICHPTGAIIDTEAREWIKMRKDQFLQESEDKKPYIPSRYFYSQIVKVVIVVSKWIVQFHCHSLQTNVAKCQNEDHKDMGKPKTKIG